MHVTFEIVEPGSNLLEEVIKLGDIARSTLGFLPREAFSDYAKKRHIIAAVENEILLGYVLFSQRKHSIKLVQLCVGKDFRNQGIAQGLMDELKRQCDVFIPGITLNCRRDYEIDGLWRKLGFSPVAEKEGRATTKDTILTNWYWKNPDCLDLFSQLEELSEKRKVVLDSNIVIALADGNDEETACLLNPILSDAVEYFITKDALVEINTKEDQATRNRHRDYALNHFNRIDKYNENLYQNALKDLAEWKNINNSNTEIDASHIAYSIAAGAYAFITKDEAWLKNRIVDQVYKKYGMMIESPGQLLLSIDELQSPHEYMPSRLAGLGFQYALMSSDDFGKVVDSFFDQYKERKKRTFSQDLRNWMASPDHYKIELIKDERNIAALIVSSTKDTTLDVHVLLINNKVIAPSIYFTFVIRLAFHILEDAKERGLTWIRILKGNISEGCRSPLVECGYFEKEAWFERCLLMRVMEWQEIKDVVNRAIDISRYRKPILAVAIEKMLWPGKFTGTEIPCFIVPIQADYAMELFDEKLKNTNISFFGNEKTIAALSNENVYFKKKRNSIPSFPARILWYVSENNRLAGTRSIRACSYLDFVDSGTIKELHRKYKRIGVLDWDQMMRRIGKPDDLITAYKFSYTELFQNEVSLESIRRILDRHNITFQSYIQISEDQFLNIYRQGIANG